MDRTGEGNQKAKFKLVQQVENIIAIRTPKIEQIGSKVEVDTKARLGVLIRNNLTL